MTRFVLLTTLLIASGIAQAQSMSRADLKKPLSDTVEKALADFVQLCVPEKRKQLATYMEDVIKAVDASATLTASEKSTLEAEAKNAVEVSVKTWQPKAVVMMRTYLSRNSDAQALRHIGIWKPEAAGPDEPIEDWTPPDEERSWLAALKNTLGEPRFTSWHDADVKAKAKAAKEIAAYLERWVRESRGPMNEDLRAKIELMKKKFSLTEAQTTALNKAAEALLDRISDAEKKRAIGMLRTLPAEARERIMNRSYFSIRFDRPRGEAWDKAWEDAAAKVLSSDLIAEWKKTDKEEQGKAENELADMIKPSEQQAEQQMEIVMTAEIDSIVTSLDLDKERVKALEKLSKEAIQESLKQARKGWLQQAKNYSATERKRISGNVYFGVSEEQQAMKLPVWTEGIKKLLSEEERTRMTAENKQREERTVLAIARACLAEMDRTLVLNQDQRTKLEPLLMVEMQPLLERRRQQYWSYNTTQLFQNAGKVKQEMLQAVLDDVQLKHWKELVTSNSSSSRNAVMPNMNGPGPEVPDMEVAISAHLYKMFVAERSKMLTQMMPQVEDATRVLTLPSPTVARLTTAAKGAVEAGLEYWRQNIDRYVRQSVQTATPKNILQALAGTERVSFGRNESGPQNTDIWKTALKTTLNEAQQKKLQQVMDERHAYRLRAMAAMSVSELDRRRKLSADQCARIETAVQKILTEYLPDIERYMSHQWFLQYYYALVPMGGVGEKEMQTILTPEQWKLCKERDLPDALQYWEGIQNNHAQRLRQGAQANGNQIIFNGGLIIDQ
ncbi:hypothetical protein [Prosthecobacter sp.]|uniref:hypothetical protein n=1 Tax=Prosthecobacter sp. TaxID=1965333 RepID=UPI001D621945|nr:hypothetical protein [Prosthecobacter sp.]MCB1275501.1 hypothetical protein [Prosthecobacter sp.]